MGNNQQPDKIKPFVNQIKNKIEQTNCTRLNFNFDKKNIDKIAYMTDLCYGCKTRENKTIHIILIFKTFKIL